MNKIRDNLDKLQALEELSCRINTLEKIPMEEKIIAAFEEGLAYNHLEPWELSQITQQALSILQEFLPPEQTDLAFDVIYEAIAAALDRARRNEE